MRYEEGKCGIHESSGDKAEASCLWAQLRAAVACLNLPLPLPLALELPLPLALALALALALSGPPRRVVHRVFEHETTRLEREQFLLSLIVFLPTVCVVKRPTRGDVLGEGYTWVAERGGGVFNADVQVMGHGLHWYLEVVGSPYLLCEQVDEIFPVPRVIEGVDDQLTHTHTRECTARGS